MATFKSEYELRYPPPSLISEVVALSNPSFFRQLYPKPPLTDLKIFADASTEWGIGIWIGDQWATFRLLPSWKIPGRDICWLETLAIELLSYFLEKMRFKDSDVHLLVHSDNQGTIGAVNKGRSPNNWINWSIRHLYSVLLPHRISFEMEYIESESNPAARGKQKFFLIHRAEFFFKDRRWEPTNRLFPYLEGHSHDVTIPELKKW